MTSPRRCILCGLEATLPHRKPQACSSHFAWETNIQGVRHLRCPECGVCTQTNPWEETRCQGCGALITQVK